MVNKMLPNLKSEIQSWPGGRIWSKEFLGLRAFLRSGICSDIGSTYDAESSGYVHRGYNSMPEKKTGAQLAPPNPENQLKVGNRRFWSFFQHILNFLSLLWGRGCMLGPSFFSGGGKITIFMKSNEKSNRKQPQTRTNAKT